MNTVTSDLEAGSREPIHIPGAIQPHGALFSVRPSDLTVLQKSADTDDFLPGAITLGCQPGGAIKDLLEPISSWHSRGDVTLQIPLPEQDLTVVAHRSGHSIIIELERGHARDQSQTDVPAASICATAGAELHR
nr:hypothetical protein [Rhizobium halophilum]